MKDKELNYPPISEILIKCLDRDFPDKIPRKEINLYTLGILVGQQQVIDKLKFLVYEREMSNSDSLNDTELVSLLKKMLTNTYNLTLAKTNAEAAKALRTSFYEVPKEQQGIVMSNVINNIIKNHPDIPKDDLVNNVLVPMSVRVISEHTGSIEQLSNGIRCR